MFFSIVSPAERQRGDFHPGKASHDVKKSCKKPLTRMKKIPRISEAEWEIMKVIWAKDPSVSGPTLLDAKPKKRLSWAELSEIVERRRARARVGSDLAGRLDNISEQGQTVLRPGRGGTTWVFEPDDEPLSPESGKGRKCRLTEARVDPGEWEIWSSGNIARSVAFR